MIRAATPQDAPAIAAVYAPYVLDTVVSFEEVAPSPAVMRERMATGLPWLVVEEDGAVLGYAYASPHHVRPAYRWSVDVSVYLDSRARGRGVGRALYGELLPLLADLGYVCAFAGVTLPNEASVRLHEAMGFHHVGVFHRAGFKRGRWWDVGWWQRPLVPPPAEPAEPRTWRDTHPPP